MKVLVLLSLIAFCASLPTWVGRRLSVGEDGTITLIGTDGHQIDIFRNLKDRTQVYVVFKTTLGPHRIFTVDKTEGIRKVKLNNILGGRFITYDSFDQVDVLAEVFRQYEGIVDDRTFNILWNKIELLVETGVIDRIYLDVLRNWNLEGQVHDVRDVTGEFVKYYTPVQGLNTIGNLKHREFQEDYLTEGRETVFDQYRNVLTTRTPVHRFDTLLEQIRRQRQVQDILTTPEELVGQTFWSIGDFEEELTHEQLLEKIYQQQYETTPLNQFLVNRRLTNGQRVYVVPEEFVTVQDFDRFVYQQELINEQVRKIVKLNLMVPEELVYQQRIVNQQVSKIIDQLLYHQTVIDRQIEQYIQSREVVPQELVYQQRLVYVQVHDLINKLADQQEFINYSIEHFIQNKQHIHSEFFVQQRIVFEQVQRLIQQLLVEQTHVKQQLLVLVQQQQVVPQQLIAYQKLTYQLVERSIEVLVKQFFYQQIHFKQLIQLFVQQGRVVPEELISQYFIIYKELLQLIHNGDVVSQELIHQQRLIHQQILMLIQNAKIVSQQFINQWIPEEEYVDYLVPQEYQYTHNRAVPIY